MTKKPAEPPAPDPDEQSGSTGRDPGPRREKPGVDGKPGTGENTGQGSYGQSGFGKGRYDKGDQRTSYQKDEPGRRNPGAGGSNLGAGTRPADEGSEEKSSEP